MKTRDFDFDLPEHLIARNPASPRDHSRLMIIDRAAQSIRHAYFYDIKDYIASDDLIVLNNTKVIPARLFADNGKTEILLLEPVSETTWKAIGKPGKNLKPGRILTLDIPPDFPTIHAEVLKIYESGERLIRLPESVDLNTIGEMPLPPYIQKARKIRAEKTHQTSDLADYQTTFAQSPGSVAAPTAGLHFTEDLLSQFNHAFVTLHVGMGTFQPIRTEEVEDYEIHEETFSIPEGLAASAAQAKRIIACGTTSARVLESRPKLDPGPGATRIYIYPPYRFQRVDALITNFHLPGSSLLVLIAAFMGKDLQREVYREAIAKEYRFYSYGDAMLIL